MIDRAAMSGVDEQTPHTAVTRLRLMTAAASDPRDAEIAALRARIAELEAQTSLQSAVVVSDIEPESEELQKRALREMAAKLFADAWAETQEMKRRARALAEQAQVDLAVEAAETRAALAAEQERHEATMAQERQHHEAALRALSEHRDRVIEEIAVLCRGLADAAQRAHDMTHVPPLVPEQ